MAKAKKIKRTKTALPIYVTRTATRHGTPILQFNRPGFPKYTFQAEPGTADFMVEYVSQFPGLTARIVPDNETLEAFETFADWLMQRHPATMIKLPVGHFVPAESLVIMRRAMWQRIQADRSNANATLTAAFKRVEHADQPLP